MASCRLGSKEDGSFLEGQGVLQGQSREEPFNVLTDTDPPPIQNSGLYQRSGWPNHTCLL